ncbi:MAG TPA: type I DNA topoisomerase [Dehalococcoidia bacterium]|nr:type I DNA topoisomerase [Dehalococcoidia bacterium]
MTKRSPSARRAGAKSPGGRSLVVVESPAKARTIANILGRTYEVKASVGHVRDLPKSALGVDVRHGFEPYYLVPKEKRQVVKDIQDAAKGASAVFLATDPDREGEAIAWHLMQAAELDDSSLRRVVFHEITAQAVKEAFRHPRGIDMQLVDAQQARRVLDRLVGYKLSPVLWKKIRGGLSAGRVQSVALRLVVEREREIQGFVAQEYWTIEAEVQREAEPPSFRARLVGVVGKRGKLEIGGQGEADRIVGLLEGAAYRVASVQKKQQVRRPSPPFITSTLQQEASRRLGFSAQRTMSVAQQLYEGLPLGGEGEVGLITYMRTDSTQVAESAREETRRYIREKFGADFVPPSARVYKKKVKGAQEAHEAIRPTSTFREPEAVHRFLSRDQHRLYTLIWQRMVASQMVDARYDVTTADIEAKPLRPAQGRPTSGGDAYLMRATNTQMVFPGYRQLYVESREEGEEEDVGKNPLPPLAEGDGLRLLGLFPEQHFTEPPPRYTEASLIRALEEKGIGRPSTYAPILATVQQRGYVEKTNGRLRPEELGVVVNDLLTTYFPDIVDVNFTAEMEEHLDEIARGERPWQPVIEEFYAPLMDALAAAADAPPVRQETTETCDLCGRPMVIRWGRRGRFLACSGYPECRNTRPLEGEGEPLPASDDPCPECGSPMVAKQGRFGPFLACSRYPQCKGTRPLVVKTGVRCPQCAGDLVEKRSRRGRVFYGCDNYPRCRFVTWSRPLATPCPQCGGLMAASGRDKARCLQCSWRGNLPEEAAAGARA